MLHRLYIIGLVFALFAAAAATATETEKRGVSFCFPAKSVPKVVDELAEVKEKYRNIVDVIIDPKFIIKDGGVWPEKFYLAREGEIIIEMPFSRDDGRVPSFMTDVRAAPDTDICVDDPTRADRPATDEGLYFEMGLSPLFANRSGRHSIEEVIEGAKDGKKFYKKMLPKAFAFLIPATNYLAVKYEDIDTALKAFAVVKGEEIALTSERYKDFDVIDCQELEALGAQALIIRGGPYYLQPVPSPSIMRRFGWGQNDKD